MTWAEHIDLLQKTPTFKNVANPLEFSAPEDAGLYLVGNTLFNPFTKEELYFVKVGRSKNLSQRMKEYRVTNPGMFHIAFMELDQEWLGKTEWQCHAILYAVCKGIVENSTEWVCVSKEVYLEICSKGWKYFSEKMT